MPDDDGGIGLNHATRRAPPVGKACGDSAVIANSR